MNWIKYNSHFQNLASAYSICPRFVNSSCLICSQMRYCTVHVHCSCSLPSEVVRFKLVMIAPQLAVNFMRWHLQFRTGIGPFIGMSNYYCPLPKQILFGKRKKNTKKIHAVHTPEVQPQFDPFVLEPCLNQSQSHRNQLHHSTTMTYAYASFPYSTSAKNHPVKVLGWWQLFTRRFWKMYVTFEPWFI